MMLKEKYQNDFLKLGFKKDSFQENIIDILDNLSLDVIEYFRIETSIQFLSFFKKLCRKKIKKNKPKGVYLWGGVGRGKTYLMNSFYEILPIKKKIRLHFHSFMNRVHEELKTLNGLNPLELLADKWKLEIEVICLDEFVVSDISDAMILSVLLKALFDRGIILVITSNIQPNHLYRNGFNREQFLSAIHLIEKNCIIINIRNNIDYRLLMSKQAERYYYPLTKSNNKKLIICYKKHLKIAKTTPKNKIKINNHYIKIIGETGGLLYATFEQLCQSNRNQNDYIKISMNYHTVLLANVKQMNHTLDDVARRFIALVDQCYECCVKLVISAEVPLELLYSEGQLKFEFERCCSRLNEMQSKRYSSRKHLFYK
ncbi:hypothetical protein CF66_2180 [Candidatus Photodesmus katoptron]|uniref:AFG1-like ATPase protein n=1 Tax=Candidatus Photodesmus katoptron Akat1 TaxID=1236703 RepID=S3DH79_9GAMM|nr:cell division protein ZapE [Candidatus Photodesmus katoptron]EPE37777.1 AFG1-like ATPase protein [Candidatus Photodesmus katoptron Akat1]KEY90502.1 hypothetical protein CF66_2180 [Candidatus Photodesmus katoptron]